MKKNRNCNWQRAHTYTMWYIHNNNEPSFSVPVKKCNSFELTSNNSDKKKRTITTGNPKTTTKKLKYTQLNKWNVKTRRNSFVAQKNHTRIRIERKKEQKNDTNNLMNGNHHVS